MFFESDPAFPIWHKQQVLCEIRGDKKLSYLGPVPGISIALQNSEFQWHLVHPILCFFHLNLFVTHLKAWLTGSVSTSLHFPASQPASHSWLHLRFQVVEDFHLDASAPPWEKRPEASRHVLAADPSLDPIFVVRHISTPEVTRLGRLVITLKVPNHQAMRAIDIFVRNVCVYFFQFWWSKQVSKKTKA